MSVISVSLSPKLLERLDEFVDETGHSSRSEVIRLAVRDTLSQRALQQLNHGKVLLTATVIYDREKHNVNTTLMNLRHEFDENIFGNMHIHIGNDFCVEIFLVQGESKNVLEFLSKIQVVKGLNDVKYSITKFASSV
jgi:CopG family nickel-responsive transcriptional regulator